MKRSYLLMLVVLFLFTNFGYSQNYLEQSQEYKDEGKLFYALATLYDGMEAEPENEDIQSEFESLVSVIETGNFNEPELDDAALHAKWTSFLQELEVYFCNDLPVALKIGEFTKSKISYSPRESIFKVKIGVVQTEKYKKLLGDIVYPAFDKVKQKEWTDLPEIRRTGGGYVPVEYRYIGTAFLSDIGHVVADDDAFYETFNYKSFYEDNKVFLSSYNNRNYVKNTNEYHNPSPIWGENLATRVNFLVTYDLVDENGKVLFNSVSEMTSEYPWLKEAYPICFTADEDLTKIINEGNIKIVLRKLKMFYGFYDATSDQTKLKRSYMFIDPETVSVIY